MAQILGLETGVSVPSVASSWLGGNLTIILAVIILIFTGIIGIWLWINYRTFNKKIILFENISGQGYQVTARDKARVVKIGDGGEEILFLKKKKVYRTAYGKKMGKNTYWFAVGQDGYWYNITLGDLDAKMGMLDIEPVDRDMRYMHVAIRKNITDRYRKIGFMEKYSTIVFGGIFFLIIIIGLYFLIDQIGTLIQQAATLIEASKESVQAAAKLLGQADVLSTGGSGIITG